MIRKPSFFASLFVLASTLVGLALSAAADPALLQAKREAEAKGLIFETSREEIVAKAKREGRLRIVSGWAAELYPHLIQAFRKRYPFIEVHIEETAGIETAQRNLLEVQAGAARNWDIVNNHPDFYSQFAPHAKKFDILGMARHGVLNIPMPMIDPKNRNLLLVSSHIQVLAYNKKLVSAERAPNGWEDLLKPEFKGRKFAADIRPTQIASLVPAWGLERTISFAKRLAGQQPAWVRGGERNVTTVMAGEFQFFVAPNFSTVRRAQAKDPAGVLGFKVLEPVPTRLSKSPGILNSAGHPYAALLWTEFEASPEAQKLADMHEPYGASVFISGSASEEITRGKQLSVVDWDHFQKLPEYQAAIVKAYGFPKVDKPK